MAQVTVIEVEVARKEGGAAVLVQKRNDLVVLQALVFEVVANNRHNCNELSSRVATSRFYAGDAKGNKRTHQFDTTFAVKPVKADPQSLFADACQPQGVGELVQETIAFS